MTNKPLSDLVIELSKGISEIFHHPDYRAIDCKGYEANASLGNAYQAVDLNAEIVQNEKEQK